jgi:hypothetical protein
MDRQMIVDHLALAERHVADGRAHIEKQRALTARLEQNGYATKEAVRLLNIFLDLEAAHIADRDRLRHELENVPDPLKS